MVHLVTRRVCHAAIPGSILCQRKIGTERDSIPRGSRIQRRPECTPRSVLPSVNPPLPSLLPRLFPLSFSLSVCLSVGLCLSPVFFLVEIFSPRTTTLHPGQRDVRLRSGSQRRQQASGFTLVTGLAPRFQSFTPSADCRPTWGQ